MRADFIFMALPQSPPATGARGAEHRRGIGTIKVGVNLSRSEIPGVKFEKVLKRNC